MLAVFPLAKLIVYLQPHMVNKLRAQFMKNETPKRCGRDLGNGHCVLAARLKGFWIDPC